MTMLSYFISHFSNKFASFFKVLKKINYFAWTKEYEDAFQQLKLSILPALSKLVNGENYMFT